MFTDFNFTGARGLEPPTYGFGDRCSTIELHPYIGTPKIILP